MTAVVSSGVGAGGRLPAEVTVDPAGLDPAERPARLPGSLGQAVERLEADDLLRQAMGEPLLQAFLAVRRAEIERFGAKTDEEVVAATRWTH